MQYLVEYNVEISAEAKDLIVECVVAQMWCESSGLYSIFTVQDLLEDFPEDLKIIDALIEDDVDYIEV